MPRSRLLWITLVLPALLVIWFVWNTQVPLGVPSEWVWDRQELNDPWYLTMIPAVVAGGLFMTFVWWGAPRLSRCSRGEACVWLAGLAVGSFAWLCIVQECAPHLNQLSKAGYVLYFRGPSGYFSQAREEAADLRKYLAEYNSRMSEGEVYHIGTHPPGLVVVFRGVIELCRNSPRLTSFLRETESSSARAAFNEISGSARKHDLPLRAPDRAALWLAFLLMQASAALAVFPLYGLLRRSHSADVAWLATSLWPAVPAVATFLPKSDVLFAGLGITIGWLWLASWRRPVLPQRLGELSESRQIGSSGNASYWGVSAIRWMAAGMLFWFGMTLSLALLPVAFLLGVATFWDLCGSADTDRSIRDRLLPVVVGVLLAATVFVLCTLAVRQICGLNLFQTWLWNYRNHAGFYDVNPRTYAKWLMVNPVEFAIAAGPPLIVLAAWGVTAFRRPFRAADAGISMALLLTWSILWLTGKNMGEAARLWTFLTPWLIIPAARTLSHAVTELPNPSPRDLLRGRVRLWRIACGCQLAVNVALVMRVTGFPLPFPILPG